MKELCNGYHADVFKVSTANTLDLSNISVRKAIHFEKVVTLPKLKYAGDPLITKYVKLVELE